MSCSVGRALGKYRPFHLGPTAHDSVCGWPIGCQVASPHPLNPAAMPLLGAWKLSQDFVLSSAVTASHLVPGLGRGKSLATTELWPLVTYQASVKLTCRGKEGSPKPSPEIRRHRVCSSTPIFLMFVHRPLSGSESDSCDWVRQRGE